MIVELLNRIANAPEVLRNVAPGRASIDLSAFFNSPDNVMAADPDGVLLFGALGGDRYEMHYLFTEALRGRAALLFTREALRFMFTQHNALAIQGSTPRENRAARAMNRALGARPTGVSIDTSGRACIDYVLERATWAVSSAES